MTAARHPLHVSSEELFGKPVGNLGKEEWKRWKYENGELFLARLPLWQRMSGALGEHRAAEMLKRARDDSEAFEIFRQWRGR